MSEIEGPHRRQEVRMQMNPYLSFQGQCEAAFNFYEQCLGGQIEAIFRYAGTPLADQVPADWQDKVMHGSLRLGDQVLMGCVMLVASVAGQTRLETPRPIGYTLRAWRAML
ncbi:MAG: hypothetical protein HY000_08165 [Planctomycetes bacterium]|nr:hypothetical protein [Planctomycetota bacterium]